jgi:hypothetical protein
MEGKLLIRAYKRYIVKSYRKRKSARAGNAGFELVEEDNWKRERATCDARLFILSLFIKVYN